jgi:hemoglobin
MKRQSIAWFMFAVLVTVSQAAFVCGQAAKTGKGIKPFAGQQKFQDSSRKPACGCYVCGKLIAVEFPDKASDCAGILAEDACVRRLSDIPKEERAGFCQKVKAGGKFNSFKDSCPGFASVCEDGPPVPTGGRAVPGTRGRTIYERLGGSETLGKIFDDVGPRMAADPLLAQFFQGQSADALKLQRDRTIEFLCYATGGPCEYKGQPIKKAHGALNISEAQWKAFVKHLGETLDHLRIGEKEKLDVLALVGRYKSDVVTKKK